MASLDRRAIDALLEDIGLTWLTGPASQSDDSYDPADARYASSKLARRRSVSSRL